ncbi:alpha/beta-hydrolase [Aspergillus heteromorphus CBS 117.55]|uniref:Alpha/beta-hydrolase n=1 Tax=Aspergillus heteromorphus CBS 117.55 TaxID=1448321 RepID=A0A317WIN9_9EURO|nr:alpha/beta-hydrolase [Aspergillus heteromorphus CBS 117.55]PWY85915.1 alpha/beta-hydrolase [Aspergillus heteromorphus CBS 117.55]
MIDFILIGPPDAPLIITLHDDRGFGESPFCNSGDHTSDFRAYTPLTSTHRLLSFDYRGHGQSLRTAPYAFQQLVDDIEALRHHFLGPDPPAIICGGSFGGFLALQYAIQHAGKVSHLILRGTAASHHHEAEALSTLQTRLHRAPSLSVSMLRDKIFGSFSSDIECQLVMHAAASPFSETFDADVALRNGLGTVFHAEEAHKRGKTDALYAEPEKRFDYRAQLGSITARSLVRVGEQDWICPPAQSETIARGVPEAKLVVVAGANHAVHLERNELVVWEIRAFFEGI